MMKCVLYWNLQVYFTSSTDVRNLCNYWMGTTRDSEPEGMSNTAGRKKVGDETCVHSINSIPRTRKPERNYTEPENSKQKIDHKISIGKGPGPKDVEK